MTVYVADAHAYIQKLISVVKMMTVLEECTTEEQSSIELFLWVKGSNAKNIYKVVFPVLGGKCPSFKGVHNWVEKFSQGFSKVADDETEVRKWLRQQSKDFYAAGFDALIMRCNQCISVGGGYVKK
jgi:hypothetical protein